MTDGPIRLLRPTALAERAAIANLLDEANQSDGVDPWVWSSHLRGDLDPDRFEQATGRIVLARSARSLVGVGLARRDVRDDVAVYWNFVVVAPAARRRGVGQALLQATEALGQRLASPSDRERAYGSWTLGDVPGSRAFLERAGYGAVRRAYWLRRSTADPPPAPPLPAGLDVRPVVSADHRAIFDACAEAFADSWGFRRPTDADFEALFADPGTDTTLWQVAWDGGTVAGGVLPLMPPGDSLPLRRARLGWLFVRRRWRRRGLARALAITGLAALRGRGVDEVVLSVDPENPTSALELYGSLGFTIAQRSTQFRRSWGVQSAS